MSSDDEMEIKCPHKKCNKKWKGNIAEIAVEVMAHYKEKHKRK